MSVNQVCSSCKSVTSLRAKVCKNCSYKFGSQKKYKVVVKGVNGKRTAKILDDLNRAKKYESKLRTQVAEHRLFGVVESPLVDDVWEKYLSWAKQNKKSWPDDERRWTLHIEPHLKGMKMDAISAYDLEKVTSQMKSNRDYAPATVRQVLVLISRS